MVFKGSEWDNGRNILIVHQRNADFLDTKQVVDYYEYRKSFLKWMLQFGKEPEKAEGYSPYTVYNTGQRAATFDLWAWEYNREYSQPPTQETARAFMDEKALEDVTNSTKGKWLEMLRRYSSWLQAQFGEDEWEFSWNFTSGGGNPQPRDFLSKQERQKIRNAALSVDGNPAYGIEDKDALQYTDSSWKFTTLVWVSLDAGLRPVEVRRARTSWVDTTNSVLRIPREDSAKNDGNWTVSLTDRTSTALDYWLDEREKHPRYDDTDRLWLTRHGNPYPAQELRRILHKLCDVSGIDTQNRSMSWYTIRHSVGTHMTRERDLAAAMVQLRHRNPQTTMKYDQVPVEDRRDALDQMG